MSNERNTYEAPKVDDLTNKETKEVKPEPPKKAIQQSAVEATFKGNQDVIGVKELSGSANITTDIITKRIKRHMAYLTGEVGFKDSDERIKEQVTFIETIGNTLRLPYDQYVIVTNVLINEMKENIDIFRKGLAFRFTRGLDKLYPPEIISTYETYISFLSVIAANWNNRYRLDRLVDLTYAIQKLEKAGKENTTRYFKSLIANS